MASEDLKDAKRHATQTFVAVDRGYQKINLGIRFLINVILCTLFFIAGYITCHHLEQFSSKGTIEKVAAQPDLPNNCKYRYDRAMEYAIMHECVYAKGVPSDDAALVQRINYCTCTLESVQKRKPYQKMFENNLVDFTFKIREENLCQEDKSIPTLESEETFTEHKNAAGAKK